MPGLIAVAAITAMLAVVLGVVFYAGDVRLFVRRHLPAPATPTGRPIEALAADVRRLRAASLHVAPGSSHVRRRATLSAYDDVLAQACLALGLPDTLSDLTPGTDREAERLRVESLLEAAGLRITSAND